MAATAMVATPGQLLRSFSLGLLLLLCCRHGSAAQLLPWGGASRRGAARECSFDGGLEALVPRHRVQSEAGFVEYYSRFNEADEQLTCAGVFPIRVVVEPQGLVLPRYSNNHALVYIPQGRGVVGFSFPGCPETYRYQQQHKIEQGEVVAMPAGAQHWLYNDDDAAPLVAVYVFDTNNNINQLEPSMRKFLLAGGFSKGQRHFAENVFKGIDVQLLSEVLGVSTDVATRLQSRNDERGEIVRVEHGLQLLGTAQDCQQEQQIGDERYKNAALNDNLCTMEMSHNVENPDQADVYNPGVGRITRLNSQKFPILDLIQMSAVRVDLYQNAILSPFWNFNAHSVMYTIQGRARVQVVSDNGTTVFDGVLRLGQLLIIPQNYVVTGKAKGQGFRYISFKTNPNSVVSHIAGKNSFLRDTPVDVIATSYGISREEATELKNNRKHELGVFAPRYHKKRGHVGRAQE